MVEPGIRTIVEIYLKTLAKNGVVVTHGILFGSQAKGNAGVWSDIDLLIVSPKFDAQCPDATTLISSGGLQPARTAELSLFPAVKNSGSKMTQVQ